MIRSLVTATAVLAVGSTVLFSIDAQAGEANGLYVTAFGGLSIPQIVNGYDTIANLKYKAKMKTPGFIVGGAVGMEVFDNFRAEAEIAYRRYALKSVKYSGFPSARLKGDAGALSFMGNIWYDIALDSMITPYFGAGVGLAYATYHNDVTGFKDSDTGFIFQLGAGAKVAMSDNISLDIGYRFRGIPGLKFKSGGLTIKDNDYFGHNFIAGMTFKF